MDFECTDDVPFPAEEVHRLLRDDMTAILPFLSDVEAIEVKERKEEPDGIRITNFWRGSIKAAPKIAQKFITKDLVSWTDHAFWPSAERRAEWRLEPRVGAGVFECTGKTSVLDGATPGTCRIRVEGKLAIYPERVPGVPRIMAKAVRGTIESVIVAMIVPNMKTLARGVKGYFESRRREPG